MDDNVSERGRGSRPSAKDGQKKRDKSKNRGLFKRKKSFANGPPA